MFQNYLEFSGYKRYVDLKKLDFIVSNLRNYFYQNNLRGLDFGCGKGNVTFPLASLGYNMTGIDISIDELITNNILDNKIDFIVADAENLPFNKAKFDFVICSEVLEHLNSPEYALNSINSVLKADGLLIVTVPNGYGPFSLTHDFNLYSDYLKPIRNEIIPKIFPNIQPSPHIQLFTRSKINKLLLNTGFEVLNFSHSDFISFLPILVRSNRYSYYDCKLADKLPSAFVSGFYIIAKKK